MNIQTGQESKGQRHALLTPALVLYSQQLTIAEEQLWETHLALQLYVHVVRPP